MAKTKQFTIAVENEPGTVAGIAKTLGNAKVNILALLAVAHGANGTLELVVDNAARAKKALDDAKITLQETAAEEYELPNKPGALAHCLDRLAAKGINLNSICATVSKGGKKVVVICAGGSKAKAAAAEAKTATASGR
jgi:hypothetical protein